VKVLQWLVHRLTTTLRSVWQLLFALETRQNPRGQRLPPLPSSPYAHSVYSGSGKMAYANGYSRVFTSASTGNALGTCEERRVR